MEHFLLSVIITLLISTISGNVEISFMKAVPRLNDLMYCDYYFACHAQGETLQWIVNNNNISDYSEQSVDRVFTGSISTCNYITTLLLLKPMPPGLSIFDSLLIVSCQDSIGFDVNCTNGLVSSMTHSSEKDLTTRADNSIPSVKLEHVLNANLVDDDYSSCTNIFVCGVDNNFITWQIQENYFLFSNFDNIGMVRQFLQDTTTVKQQAILIGKEVSRLVVVMIVIGSAEINVTCGYLQNNASISTNSCPTNLGTTVSETTLLETTVSETSTDGVSSTIAIENDNVSLIAGLSTFFGILLVLAVVIVIIVLCCLRYLNKNIKRGIPFRDNNCNEIKKPKEKMSIDYNEFYEQVEYIFLTRNENAVNAATTILTAPDIENTTENQLTSIDEDVFIGMIGSHHICLVNETENNFQERLENIIIKYFPNAKYLVFVGKCFVTRRNILNLADIVIAKRIHHKVDSEIIAPEIRSKFCLYPNKVEKFFVEKFLFKKNREAKHLVSVIASGTKILKDEDSRDFARKSCDGIDECEETSGELLSHFKKEIHMRNNTTKKMQVITIGAITGYVDGETVEEHEEWQFIAFQAVFHYIASKMTDPYLLGDISYEIKDPVSVRELTTPMSMSDTSHWKEGVHYLILLLYRDEFYAATANISGPNPSDNIIKITDDVYMGLIGSHKVGVLYFSGNQQYYNEIMKAIKDHFPNAKYLIRVGACAGRNEDKTNLGDVLISKSIHYIHNKGRDEHDQDKIIMTPEINQVFGKSHEVNGLLLPGNRNAEHFEVQIASGSGMNIRFDKRMQEIAIQCPENLGFEESGGALVCVKNSMAAIHIIIITGVSCYRDTIVNDEWNFVASQAAFHYVTTKMKEQQTN